MQFIVAAQHVRMSPELEEQVRHRVRSALGRFADRIARVSVRIADVNAGRGGVDKRCLIEAQDRRLGLLVAKVRDLDIGTAVSRAADRIVGQLRKGLQRRRALRRRGVD